MPIISPMTELDAVNEMLMSIGQAPVNTLEVTGITDVSIAKQRLENILRRTLSRGWAFNTDASFELTPDIDKVIVLPANALKVTSDTANITIRRHEDKGLALWDLDNQTFEFDEAVTCTIVRGFSFEDIPQTARDYVATAAGRRFQSKVIGSQILDRFEEEDEMKCWIALQREERAARNTNLFRGNPTIAGFGSRTY